MDDSAIPGTGSDETGSPPEGVRRRRLIRRWVASVAVPALIVTGLTLLGREQTPAEVVTDYLEALRTGDVDTAWGYTDKPSDWDLIPQGLVTDNGSGDDWSIGQVTAPPDEPDVEGSVTTVIATVTGEDGATGQGRFALVASDAGWRITNPLVTVDVSALPTGYAEFGAVAVSARQVVLLPGVYRTFTGSADLFDTGAPEFVAVPTEAGAVTAEAFLPQFTPTAEFDTALGDQSRDWIDDCATSTLLTPADCPLKVNTDRFGFIDIDGKTYTADHAKWTIEEYPTGHAVQGEEGFAVRTTAYGRATVTITGVADGDTEATMTVDCGLDFDGVAVRPGADGRFAFTANPEGCDLPDS